MELYYLLTIAQKSKKIILSSIFTCSLFTIFLAHTVEEKWTSTAQVRHSAAGYLGMLMSLRQEGKIENDVDLYKKFLENLIEISADVDSKASFLKMKHARKISKDWANDRIYVSRDGYNIESYQFQLTANSPENAQAWLKEYIEEMNQAATDELINKNNLSISTEEKAQIKLYQYNFEPTYPSKKVGPHKVILVLTGVLSGIFLGFLMAIFIDSKKTFMT